MPDKDKREAEDYRRQAERVGLPEKDLDRLISPQQGEKENAPESSRPPGR